MLTEPNYPRTHTNLHTHDDTHNDIHTRDIRIIYNCLLRKTIFLNSTSITLEVVV